MEEFYMDQVNMEAFYVEEFYMENFYTSGDIRLGDGAFRDSWTDRRLYYTSRGIGWSKYEHWFPTTFFSFFSIFPILSFRQLSFQQLTFQQLSFRQLSFQQPSFRRFPFVGFLSHTLLIISFFLSTPSFPSMSYQQFLLQL